MHKVKEMLDDGYCDIQGIHGDLVFVGEWLTLNLSIDCADLLLQLIFSRRECMPGRVSEALYKHSWIVLTVSLRCC